MAAPLDVISPITIANYGKVYWENVTENNPICRLIVEKGNLNKDMHGTSVNWPVEGGRHDVYIVSDFQDVTALYTPRKRYFQPTLPWGECASFRSISKGEWRQNGGQQALVPFTKKEIPAMFRDLAVASNLQNGVSVGGIFWQFLNLNGSTYAGTGNPLFGLPSVFTGNSAISWSSNSKNGIINNTNYAGITCVLNGLAATIDGAESDAWTPSAINTTSTAFANTLATFYLNFFQIMSEAFSQASRFSGSDTDKLPDCALLTRSMYVDAQTAIGAKQSFLLTGKVGKGAVFGIGSDTMNGITHNGFPIYWDNNLPASTGYVLNFKQIFMDMLPIGSVSGDSMPGLNVGGPVPDNVIDAGMAEVEVKYNDGRRAVTVSATFPGQFRVNPRYQVMLFAGA
jgi:hypothetical protein